MPRSLADGHTKFTILTTKPVNPASPTAAELNAGLDASPKILASDFQWGFADSDKVQEKPLSETSNAQAIGASNPQGKVTVFRYFDETTKNADVTEDEVFQAIKDKGTTAWGYARETAKLSTEDWAADDEIDLGAEFTTDEPQQPQQRTGFVKRTVPLEIQYTYPHIKVATGG